MNLFFGIIVFIILLVIAFFIGKGIMTIYNNITTAIANEKKKIKTAICDFPLIGPTTCKIIYDIGTAL
jgi:hypothetical protein